MGLYLQRTLEILVNLKLFIHNDRLLRKLMALDAQLQRRGEEGQGQRSLLVSDL